MATIREKQEAANSICDLIEEMKDDVEELNLIGSYPDLKLFDLYQKFDDLTKAVRTALTLDLIDPVKKT